MSPGRRGDRGHRDVQAVSFASGARGNCRQVLPLAAANLEDGIIGAGGREPGHRVHEVSLEPLGEQTSPRVNHDRGVSRSGRPPILGLQQVHVPAARDVERVRTGTDEAALAARERQMAAPDRTEENDTHV